MFASGAKRPLGTYAIPAWSGISRHPRCGRGQLGNCSCAPLRASPLMEEIGFVSAELFAALFNALRFLLAVLSDLSVCSFVLKVFLSPSLRRS
jgi:hypothetical protein